MFVFFLCKRYIVLATIFSHHSSSSSSFLGFFFTYFFGYGAIPTIGFSPPPTPKLCNHLASLPLVLPKFLDSVGNGLGNDEIPLMKLCNEQLGMDDYLFIYFFFFGVGKNGSQFWTHIFFKICLRGLSKPFKLIDPLERVG